VNAPRGSGLPSSLQRSQLPAAGLPTGARSALDDVGAARANVLRVLAIFRRRWWVPAVMACGAVSLLLVYSFLKPPEYVARGMVQLGMYANLTMDRQDMRNLQSSAFFETHRRLLTSNGVVEDAIRRCGIELVQGPGRTRQRKVFLKNIDIEQVPGTYLVEVTATDSDPGMVVRRVNSLMDAFIPFTTQFLGSQAEIRMRQLRQKEAELLEQLKEVEDRQEAFFRRTGRVSFDDQRSALLVNQQAIQERLTALEIEESSAAAQEERLERRLEQVDTNQDVERLAGLFGPEALESPRWQSLRRVKADLLDLQATVSEDRLAELPEYLDLQAQLAGERRALRAELKELAEASLTLQRDTLATLESTQERLQAQLEELKAGHQRLDLLEGEFRTIRNDLEWYDRELSETRGELRRLQSQAASTDAGAMIVNRADIPFEPEARFHVVRLAFVGMLAFALGLAVILVWDHLDDTVTAQDDIGHLGLPVLGQVPRLDTREVDELAHVRGSFWTSEAFGLIRTNITVAAGGLAGRAILVTSGTPRDGKSFVSINLAASLARAGGRTLLIEADMRKPRLQEILGTEHKHGLSDVLAGLRKLDAAVQPTEFEDLHLLPSGPSPLNPADLLLRGQFHSVIEEAVERYDHVVVDAPPAQPLADTSLMAPAVRGVLHVVRLRSSRRRLVTAAIDQVQSVAGNNLGIVLNDVTIDEAPSLNYAGYGGYLGDPNELVDPSRLSNVADSDTGPALFVLAPNAPPAEEEEASQLERRGKRGAVLLMVLLMALAAFGLLGQGRLLPESLQGGYDAIVGFDASPGAAPGADDAPGDPDEDG